MARPIVEDQTLIDRLVVVGATHRTAPLALRDQLFVDDAAMPATLRAVEASGVVEAAVLSTCDRVEIVALADDRPVAVDRLMALLAERVGRDPADLSSDCHALLGRDAARHCFAIAAALDSVVIGEPHVLGQIKAAHRLAREVGLAGPGLETVLGAAYGAAKRVRNETGIAHGPVTVASSAVRVARDLHGDLAERRAVLVGCGDMGQLIIESLRAAGLSDVTVTAPRDRRAKALAAAMEAHWCPFPELATAMVGADIVVASVGARTPTISEELVKGVLRKRRQRPIFVVDSSVPGDVEAAVNRVDNAFPYDLDDLETVAEETRVNRHREAEKAWAILEDALAAFVDGQATRSAGPLIAALHARFDAARAVALEVARGDAERATHAMTGRLLHGPAERLRRLARDDPAGFALADGIIRRLFEDDPDPASDESVPETGEQEDFR